MQVNHNSAERQRTGGEPPGGDDRLTDEDLDEMLGELPPPASDADVLVEPPAGFAPLGLADLLARPELLAPPPPIVPGLAWAGRVTLVSGDAKAGKSTLMGQAVAALATGGTFLGQPLEPAPALWLALDEPLPDAVRRLADFDAAPGAGRVWLSSTRPTADELHAFVAAHGVKLVVIDTGLDYAAGVVADAAKAEQWQPLLKTLREIAQATGCGVVLIYHLRKSGDRTADSRQLEAGVDAIVLMQKDGDDAGARKLALTGRVTSGQCRIRWTGWGYELAETGTLSLDARILAAVQQRPGITVTDLRKQMAGRKSDTLDALRLLLSRGAIAEQPGARGARCFFPVTPYGNRPEQVGNGSGTGAGTGRGVPDHRCSATCSPTCSRTCSRTCSGAPYRGAGTGCSGTRESGSEPEPQLGLGDGAGTTAIPWTPGAESDPEPLWEPAP